MVAGVIAAYLPMLGVPSRGWLDFSAFYAAGVLAFTPDVARLEPIVQFQSAHGLPITPFVYPSGAALAYAPFAVLPYDIAAALNVLVLFAVLLAAARVGAGIFGVPVRWAVIGTLAWGPAAAGVLSGQASSLALLLVLAAIRALQRHSAVGAGLFAATLEWKPQFAAPIAGLLILRTIWRGVASLIAGIGCWYAAGVVATGGNWGWLGDWLASIAAYRRLDIEANGWQAVSLPALLSRPNVAGLQPALEIVGFCLALLVLIASLGALRTWPAERAVALACAVGLLMSPHGWVYDATLLLPGLAVFAADAERRGWRWQDRWILAAAYGLGLTWPIGGVIGIVPVLAVTLAAPAVLLASNRGALEGWPPFRTRTRQP